MTDIQTISVIVAATSVVIAAISTTIQSRKAEKMRKTEIETRQTVLLMQLYRHWCDTEFIHYWIDILRWEWKDFDDFTKKYSVPTEWVKFISVSGFFESLALIMRMELIDMKSLLSMGYWSDSILMFWEKVKDPVQEIRKQISRAVGQWIEWLCNELKKREEQIGKVW